MLITASLLENLDRRFGSSWLSHGGEQVNVRCPYCVSRGMTKDESGHLGIHLGINKAHCIKCDWGHGNAQEWLSKYSIEIRVSVTDVRASLDSLKTMLTPNPARYSPFSIEMPPEATPISVRQNDEFTDSLLAKGVSKSLQVLNKVHYAEAGAYNGYVVFPFYEYGEQVYFQGRAAYDYLLSDPKRRKKNPPTTLGLGKNAWLYGFLPTKGVKVYLVEGTLDQISLQDHLARIHGPGHLAVSLQGTSMSFPAPDRHPLNSQWGKIRSLDPEEVIVVFDPDAWLKAKELANILQVTGFNSRAVRLCEGDPNETMARPDGDEILRKIITDVPNQFDDIERTLNAATL